MIADNLIQNQQELDIDTYMQQLLNNYYLNPDPSLSLDCTYKAFVQRTDYTNYFASFTNTKAPTKVKRESMSQEFFDTPNPNGNYPIVAFPIIFSNNIEADRDFLYKLHDYILNRWMPLVTQVDVNSLKTYPGFRYNFAQKCYINHTAFVDLNYVIFDHDQHICQWNETAPAIPESKVITLSFFRKSQSKEELDRIRQHYLIEMLPLVSGIPNNTYIVNQIISKPQYNLTGLSEGMQVITPKIYDPFTIYFYDYFYSLFQIPQPKPFIRYAYIGNGDLNEEKMIVVDDNVRPIITAIKFMPMSTKEKTRCSAFMFSRNDTVVVDYTTGRVLTQEEIKSTPNEYLCYKLGNNFNYIHAVYRIKPSDEKTTVHEMTDVIRKYKDDQKKRFHFGDFMLRLNGYQVDVNGQYVSLKTFP